MNTIIRQNRKFVINQEKIKPEHRKTSVINGLYAAIYEEFRGATVNKKYKDITNQERMAKLNDFANDWLKKRGFYQ